MKELEKKWGTPKEKHTGWVLFLLDLVAEFAIVASGYLTLPAAAGMNVLQPLPQEKYVWEKGNYKITAYGVRNAMTRYEKRIRSWDWQEKTQEGTVSAANP